jgi:hypothetical protein
MNKFSDSLKQIKMGIEVEKEHNDIYEYFTEYLSNHHLKMPMDRQTFFMMIAKKHLSEVNDYYTKLKEVEK